MRAVTAAPTGTAARNLGSGAASSEASPSVVRRRRARERLVAVDRARPVAREERREEGREQDAVDDRRVEGRRRRRVHGVVVAGQGREGVDVAPVEAPRALDDRARRQGRLAPAQRCARRASRERAQRHLSGNFGCGKNNAS